MSYIEIRRITPEKINKHKSTVWSTEMRRAMKKNRTWYIVPLTTFRTRIRCGRDAETAISKKPRHEVTPNIDHSQGYKKHTNKYWTDAISRSAFSQRIRSGMSTEDAINKPNNKYKWNWKTKTLNEVENRVDIEV